MYYFLLTGRVLSVLEWKNTKHKTLQTYLTRKTFGVSSGGFVTGFRNSRHILNQFDEKLKPIATWFHAFLSPCLIPVVFIYFKFSLAPGDICLSVF